MVRGILPTLLIHDPETVGMAAHAWRAGSVSDRRTPLSTCELPPAKAHWSLPRQAFGSVLYRRMSAMIAPRHFLAAAFFVGVLSLAWADDKKEPAFKPAKDE